MGGDEKRMPASKLFAGLDDVSGPLVGRLPGAVRFSASQEIDFRDTVAALGVFCERAPADDKLRLLYRMYDEDGDGRIGKNDLRSTLDLVLPEFADANERELVLDRA